jgi:cation diffusion facilitator family transporter
MSTEGGTKAVIAALGANLGIAAAKFVAFAMTGSSSMLSEGIHSLADSGNQMLLLFGGKRAKRGVDETFQFGYSRVRYVYGFVVAIVLFTVGGLYSLYEGIHKFQHPEELKDLNIAIAVLIFAVILEGFSFRTALKEANKARGQHSLKSFVKRVRQPELPVILLEDTGALIGLMFALFGVGMAQATGNSRWDSIGAIAVGSLLVVIAVFLALEMGRMLVGESALPEEQQAIEAALAAEPSVDRVIYLKTLHTGPDELLVAAKFAPHSGASASDIANGINAAEASIRAAVPTSRWIFLEPDIYDPNDKPSWDAQGNPTDDQGSGH